LKFVFGALLSLFILALGGMKAVERKKCTSAVVEILDCISLIKTEVSYLSADYEAIYEKGKNRNYKHISFNNEKIKLNDYCNNEHRDLFDDFTSRLGTTDTEGQLSLCEEYKQRFEIILKQRLEKDKEKLQINTALCILGSICVFVVFSW
jgi:hypothetical protein